jgi:hypothetical protein
MKEGVQVVSAEMHLVRSTLVGISYPYTSATVSVARRDLILTECTCHNSVGKFLDVSSDSEMRRSTCKDALRHNGNMAKTRVLGTRARLSPAVRDEAMSRTAGDARRAANTRQINQSI